MSISIYDNNVPFGVLFKEFIQYIVLNRLPARRGTIFVNVEKPIPSPAVSFFGRALQRNSDYLIRISVFITSLALSNGTVRSESSGLVSTSVSLVMAMVRHHGAVVASTSTSSSGLP